MKRIFGFIAVVGIAVSSMFMAGCPSRPATYILEEHPTGKKIAVTATLNTLQAAYTQYQIYWVEGKENQAIEWIAVDGRVTPLDENNLPDDVTLVSVINPGNTE